MKINKHLGWLLALLIMVSMTSIFIYADELPETVVVGSPFPRGWVSYTNVSNFTRTNVTPYALNLSRGYIHEVSIEVMQQSHRWIGYVGNITGTIALGDSSGNNLYQWDLNISSGEIYATRFHGGGSGTDADDWAQYDSDVAPSSFFQYVDWSNITCANHTSISAENTRLAHDYNIDNDAMNRTFTNESAFFNNAMDFHVAATHIDVSAEECWGTHLRNDTGNTENRYWQMVVLEDGTDDGLIGDLIYAAVVEDDQRGFNGNAYDFQILLPQDGRILNDDAVDNAPKDNIAYYFYLELVGEQWPSGSP